MATQPQVTRKDIEARLIARAWKDEAFAQELRSDPRAAVERELAQMGLNVKLPENLAVQVVEETPSTLYLVLPPRPAAGGQANELSDEDLEAVAGGAKTEDPGTDYSVCHACVGGVRG